MVKESRSCKAEEVLLSTVSAAWSVQCASLVWVAEHSRKFVWSQ